MIDQINVNIPAKPSTYPIYFGSNFLSDLESLVNLNQYSKVGIIADYNSAQYIPQISDNSSKKIYIITFPAGEVSKNIETVNSIWSEMIRYQFDKKSLLIALGGGVVGDITGLAAGCYQRGIDYIQIPTTVLAQVDSSVGGKTAIDFHDQKNNIGLFKQPVAVIVDITTLETLDKRTWLQGFGEVLKYAISMDIKLFEYLNQVDPDNLSDEQVINIIKTCCKLKSEVVEGDELDLKTRKILNFGHTAGHAIEMISLKQEREDFRLYHGEAVSIGTYFISHLANRLGLLSDTQLTKIKDLIYHWKLPIKPKFSIDFDEFIELCKVDKKSQNGIIKWVLPTDIGKALVDQEIDQEIVKEVFNNLYG